MRTVILFLAAARVYGFAAVMEHPQLPGWMPLAPSSWKLPELTLLARPGGGRFCPALGHKHVTLIGMSDDGIYRIAPAKTYKSVMCKFLADATFGSIARFPSGHVDVMAAERGLPAEVAMLHVPIDHYDPDPWIAWTHDCARAST